MSPRHAGHWSSIPVSFASQNFWQREMTIHPCTHLARQKVMRLCCWKYHYKASGLHFGLTAPSNGIACLPARLPRPPAAKETNKNNQNQRLGNGKGSSPHWDKWTRWGLSSGEWLAIRNVLKPCFWVQTKEFLRGVVVRCFSLESASDLVSNCGVADKTGVAGSVLSGAFCSCSLPVRSTTKGTREQNSPLDLLASICQLLCA